MSVGGVRSSMMNFLRKILKDSDCCHIQPLKYDDEMFAQSVNDSVCNISVKNKLFFYDAYYEQISSLRKKKAYLSLCFKIIFALLRKIIGAEKVLTLICKFSSCKDSYDLAISYENDIWNGKYFSGGANQFVIEKVKAVKTIAWVHSEPSYYGLTHNRGLKSFREFDAIVNVSYACKHLFDSIVPEYTAKSFVVYNFFDELSVSKKAQDLCPIEFSKLFNIVTVSRIVDKAKKIERVIHISKILRDRGVLFSWYVVGDGPLLEKMRNLVKEFKLEKSVCFLGQVVEPYNYVSKCDLFVLPSEQESFGMVLVESLLCGVPVVCTNYAASSEIVENGKNGLIVENSVEKIADAIEKIAKSEVVFRKEDIVFSNKAEKQFSHLLSFLGMPK